MNKYVLLFLLIFSFLNANSFDKKEKVFTEKEAKKMLGDFIQMTGETEENFNKMIKETLKDKDWHKANSAFMFDKKDIKLHKFAKEKTTIPDWKKSLELYKKSVLEKNNVISAYQGISIINQFFMFFNSGRKSTNTVKNEVLDKYVPIFSKPLIERGYCFGYSGLMKYEADFNQNINEAVNVGERGLAICKKQLQEKKIPKWLESNYRRDYVKLKAIKKIIEGKKL